MIAKACCDFRPAQASHTENAEETARYKGKRKQPSNSTPTHHHHVPERTSKKCVKPGNTVPRRCTAANLKATDPCRSMTRLFLFAIRDTSSFKHQQKSVKEQHRCWARLCKLSIRFKKMSTWRSVQPQTLTATQCSDTRPVTCDDAANLLSRS